MGYINFKFKNKAVKIIVWSLIALLGAFAWSLLATARGEQINTIYFLIAGLATYAIGYRFYAQFIVKKIMAPDDTRKTPAVEINDGKIYSPTPKVTLFGHHFASIAGAGPLVGPVLAAQMGYLPGTLWIIFGVVLAGAVQDMLVLFFSTRLKGSSLGQIAQKYLGKFGGILTQIIVFLMTLIVLAVLALICVNVMAESSWAVWSITMTLPIAFFMGLYLKFIRPGKILEISLIGLFLLIVAVWSGSLIPNSGLAKYFTLTPVQLVFYMAAYCFLVAILPVWLLLVPKDYLSMFMKVGTIVIFAIAIVIVRPMTEVPALTNFAFNSSGPAFAGKLFPFLFITIACGALSGFHATISSGTTPKMVEKESDIKAIGYGGMLMESFVALMALIAAISINQGVYFSMNTPPATIQKLAGEQYSSQNTPEKNAALAVEKLNANLDGKKIIPKWNNLTGSAALTQIAADVEEKSIVSRTGGAPTLAVSMANILHKIPVIGGQGMLGFWYHFAIMFEALFILSAVSGGTLSLRAQLAEALAKMRRLQKFANPHWNLGRWITSFIIIATWSLLLFMGVTDPNGGIKIMYPLFGIANQFIAVVAIALLTVIIVALKKVKLIWVTLIPLVWVSMVTIAASWEKIFSSDVNLGYFAMFKQAQANPSATASVTMRNSLIQGSLSVIFLILIIVLLVVCCKTVWAKTLGKTKMISQ